VLPALQKEGEMMYNGIQVGDIVRRIEGEWVGHSIGWEGEVVGLENEHLRFADSDRGHSPHAHVVIKSVTPLRDLFMRRTMNRLRGNEM